MSGLEILGIAASILQIADLGATVSVKLCSFYRQLRSADQTAQSLSSEVALTCSILRQLGENLKQDEQTRLCSVQAFETAQEVLRECEKVFRRISAAVDESRGDATKNAIQRAARRLGFVLMERELDVLKGNLERLKSTMLLLLNVIMYAGQLRSRAESSVLQEQRGLIQVLVEEKKSSERRFDQLVKALESVDIHSQGPAAQDTLPPYESLAQEDALRELRTYHQLIKQLLQEVDACRSAFEWSRYSRIRDGVVRVHAAEVEQFQQAHGAMVTRLFEDPLFSLVREMDVLEAQNQEDGKTEAAKRPQRSKPIARRRRVEESTRHRSFPTEVNGRGDVPLPLSGLIDADDFQIEHSPTRRVTVSDRMSGYLPRRRAACDYAPPPPAVIGDINNGSRNKSTNGSANNNRKQRQEDTDIVAIEPEDETILPKRRRPRARTSVFREASPLYEASPRHQRDYDLVIDQRMLERNDVRQDLDLIKQEMEIERLERELARRRGEHENEEITEVISLPIRSDTSPVHAPWEGQSKTKTITQQIQIEQKQVSAPRSVMRPSGRYEADVDAILVPATATEQEVKEAVDAVDDLLLKWTTLGQDDLLA